MHTSSMVLGDLAHRGTHLWGSRVAFAWEGHTRTYAEDEVERRAIRRFLEPLEFDCPLHYEKAVAQHYGYRDVLAPYSSILSFTIPPLWRPGMHIFTSAERNAQPAHNPLTGVNTRLRSLAPPTTGYFATDMEIEYLQPVVGDRLCTAGRKLISCVPKETRVGRGAFLVWESEIRNQQGEVVALMRTGMYQYDPHDSPGE